MSGNYGGMDRRGFLKGSAAVAAGVLISPVEALALTSSEPADKDVYKKAKRVYDLTREAWYPERDSHLIEGGVIGILNLASTGPDYDGPGRYLYVRSDKFDTTLELMVVGPVDRATTTEVDRCIANLGLRYTPPIQGIDPDYVETVHQKIKHIILKTSF